MASAGAFFDLDRTLMAGSSGMHFARAARRAGMVSRRQLLRWGLTHLRYRLRGSTDADTAAVVRQAEELLGGVPQSRLKRLVPEMLGGILPAIYPQMLAEVHAHQDAGRRTFIVSAAGDGIVGPLAQVLDMDGGIGTHYAVGPDGRFTGAMEGGLVYGPGKVEPMKRFAADHDIDLAESWAYSDSVSDLPMLELVGNPVAVNPDAELARIARDRGWRVMRFEKLGRRLALFGVIVLAGAIGTGSRFARRRPPAA